MANQTKPLQKYTAGAISCAIWANQATVNGKPTTILKATVERRYKDANGTWNSSGSYSRSDLPLVQFVLSKAFDYMLSKPDVDEAPEEPVA